MPDEIAVSICCMTYNQKEYIAEAIESFLAQKTDFPIEILVNDDCSTDGTTDIVLDYACRYPEMVHAVTHEENQFSQGAHVLTDFLYPHARGRYIAICEGDDYWTDPDKLQRQYDLMQVHNECPLCVHASITVVADTKRTLTQNRPFDHDCVIGLSSILSEVHGYATNSYFVRKSAFDRYVDRGMPQQPGHGDFKMTAFFATLGPIYYLERPMSAYRVMAKGSINRTFSEKSKEEQHAIRKRLCDERIDALDRLDTLTNGTYHADIQRGKENAEYKYLKGICDIKTIKKRFLEHYQAEPALRKIILLGRCYVPHLYALIARIVYRKG